MKRPQRTRLIAFRLTDEEYSKLSFAAKMSNRKPSGIAYDILSKNLQ